MATVTHRNIGFLPRDLTLKKYPVLYQNDKDAFLTLFPVIEIKMKTCMSFVTK